MFGVRYTQRCPFCLTTYEADHGITGYIRLRGKDGLEYGEEWCPNCDTAYWFVSSARRQNVESRLADLPFDVAVDEMKKRIDFEYEAFGNAQFRKSERVKEEIQELELLYRFEKKDLYIKRKDVKPEDIVGGTTICW